MPSSRTATTSRALIVIDYLQLVECRDKTRGRVEQLGEISKSLKQIALASKATVVATAQ